MTYILYALIAVFTYIFGLFIVSLILKSRQNTAFTDLKNEILTNIKEKRERGSNQKKTLSKYSSISISKQCLAYYSDKYRMLSEKEKAGDKGKYYIKKIKEAGGKMWAVDQNNNITYL